MALNARKDEKIQIYNTVIRQVGTLDTKYRKFIYNEEKYIQGGLWANVRALESSEKISNNLAYDIDYIQLIVNRNDKIATASRVIYRNQIYDIENIDPLDFRSMDIKIKAKKSVDNNKYEGDIFDE